MCSSVVLPALSRPRKRSFCLWVLCQLSMCPLVVWCKCDVGDDSPGRLIASASSIALSLDSSIVVFSHIRLVNVLPLFLGLTPPRSSLSGRGHSTPVILQQQSVSNSAIKVCIRRKEEFDIPHACSKGPSWTEHPKLDDLISSAHCAKGVPS